MLKLYDVVKLKKNRPDIGVTTEHLGAVIDVLEDGKAYTVEFIDSTGEEIEDSIFTDFYEEDLILLKRI